MLVEYRIKDNYVIDEMDLSVHDFKVRDIPIEAKKNETLVYNAKIKRIQNIVIPNGYYWNGSTLKLDFNFIEEQKKIEAEKKLKADIKRASLAYIAYNNGWIDNYNEEDIDNWIQYLKNKANGVESPAIIPARPQILKDF